DGFVINSDGKRSAYRNTAGVTASGVLDVANYDIYYTTKTEFYVWTFRDKSDGNDIVYQLEIDCANPIGDFGGFDEPDNPEYSLAPSISSPSDGSRVKQGGSVSAKGAVKNEGPDKSGGRN